MVREAWGSNHEAECSINLAQENCQLSSNLVSSAFLFLCCSFHDLDL
jgi:hypothetical protein